MDRDEFMELVYETFAEEPDNVLANGIIEAADAYVEHEKTQLSKGGTTSDLISRQAAIDTLDGGAEFLRRVLDVTDLVGAERTKYEWGLGLIESCIDDIKELPTIQPEERTEERTETHVCDLISRQQAIDGKIIIQRTNGVEIYYDEAVPVGYLKRLPSVQPEPKKGEWLPDNNNAYEMRFVCSCCKESEVVPTIGFTKYKPLWDFCPNCGADMRGEKDG